MTLFDPNEAERLELRYSNKCAREQIWKVHTVHPPEKDLEIFFREIHGNQVLDVGCGWGYYVHRFVEQGIDYRGIDLSPEMIQIARKTNPDVSFDVMSYRNLSFADESFDGLWCCCIFGGEPKHNMPKILLGLKRLLKPGGIITIIVPIVDGDVDKLSYDSEGNVIGWYASYTPTEIHALIDSIGFSEVTSFDRYNNGAASILARK